MSYCTIDGCNKPHLARGLCNSHYAKAWAAEHPDYHASNKRKINTIPCSIEGCPNSVLSRGICRTHYQRARNDGTLKQYYSENSDSTYTRSHPTYVTYRGMLRRCYDANSRQYKNYGGRGIRIAPEWLGRGGFVRFMKHIGDKPSSQHSVDRIDVNGNYEPGNVRWATPHEQQANRRNNVENVGVYKRKDCDMWFTHLDINGVNVLGRSYHTKAEAIAVRLYAEDIFLHRKYKVNLPEYLL